MQGEARDRAAEILVESNSINASDNNEKLPEKQLRAQICADEGMGKLGQKDGEIEATASKEQNLVRTNDRDLEREQQRAESVIQADQSLGNINCDRTSPLRP